MGQPGMGMSLRQRQEQALGLDADAMAQQHFHPFGTQVRHALHESVDLIDKGSIGWRITQFQHRPLRRGENQAIDLAVVGNALKPPLAQYFIRRLAGKTQRWKIERPLATTNETLLQWQLASPPWKRLRTIERHGRRRSKPQVVLMAPPCQRKTSSRMQW
ncbi:hypothetical protein HMPREF2830_17715 [Pseudomonas aeruginosa]|nr:hypothetical protein HMPREF2830_17715 [Pseudomonas aeruginosa]